MVRQRGPFAVHGLASIKRFSERFATATEAVSDTVSTCSLVVQLPLFHRHELKDGISRSFLHLLEVDDAIRSLEVEEPLLVLDARQQGRLARAEHRL